MCILCFVCNSEHLFFARICTLQHSHICSQFFCVTKLETNFYMLLFLSAFTENYFIYGVGSCTGTMLKTGLCSLWSVTTLVCVTLNAVTELAKEEEHWRKKYIFFYCLNVTHMIVGRASVNKTSKLGFTVFAFYVSPLIKFD